MRFIRIWIIFFCFFTLLAADWVLVKVRTARVKVKPDYLSTTVKLLKVGDRVQVLESKNNWVLIKTSTQQKGYVHESALKQLKVSLSGVLPGDQGVSDKEVALAAKGFDEESEKVLSRGRAGYNYKDLSWVMQVKIPVTKVKVFAAKGKLK